RPENNADEIATAHIDAMETLLDAGTSGKRIVLPGGIEAWREFESLVFRRVDAGARPAGYSRELGPRSASVEAGGVVLAIRRGLSSDELPELLEEARRARKEGGQDWLFAALDDEALPSDLVVRPRRPGERSLVLRHRQTIKLKKLMIDHRIP